MAEDLIEFAILFNELFTDFSWEKLGEIFYAALQFIWGALYDISNALPTLIFDGLMDVLINFFRNIGWDGVADAFEKVKELRAILGDFIRNWPTKLWNALYNIWTYIKNFFTDMFNSVGDIISDAIDDALSGIKDVGGKAADWFDSINPFATGGIVTGPTLGLVGEAGPEAIIPLDKANGVGTTYVININGDVYGVSDLEDRIERAIQRTANKAYYR